jgi:hypothetical protein
MFIIGIIGVITGLVTSLVAMHYLVNKNKKIAVAFIYFALFVAMISSVLTSIS